jgi:hypothetical protein
MLFEGFAMAFVPGNGGTIRLAGAGRWPGGCVAITHQIDTVPGVNLATAGPLNACNGYF